MIDIQYYLPELPQGQINKLSELADLFMAWNQKLNLSAIRDREGVVVKHILDSLLILGGFPGLALAITYPKTSFTLLDATQKKLKAVQDMMQHLALQNISTLWGRAEELSKDARYRERFDRVVARAVAKFPMLLNLAMPFVKPGGALIAYQGPELTETWQLFQPQAKEVNSHIEQVIDATLPIENAKRCFVIVKKK
jgi:16S rRNA (guanine527-N7)-methyltransferase